MDGSAVSHTTFGCAWCWNAKPETHCAVRMLLRLLQAADNARLRLVWRLPLLCPRGACFCCWG